MCALEHDAEELGVIKHVDEYSVMKTRKFPFCVV